MFTIRKNALVLNAMKHTLLGFFFLYILSSNVLATTNELIFQKDLVSHYWIKKDNCISLNPGYFTQVMAAYTVIEYINSLDNNSSNHKTNSKIKEKSNEFADIFLNNINENKYNYILKELNINNTEFIAMMNHNAKKLNLENTKYTSAITDNENNITTPEDIAKLTEHFFNHSKLKKQITPLNKSISENKNVQRFLNPTILEKSFFLGGIINNKWNGVFISNSINQSKTSRKIITIILNANSLERLSYLASNSIQVGLSTTETIRFFSKEESVGKIRIINGNLKEIPVKVLNDVFLTINKDELQYAKETFTIQLLHESPLLAPISKNEEVGTMFIQMNGKLLNSTPVFAEESVATGNLWHRFLDMIELSLTSTN